MTIAQRSPSLWSDLVDLYASQDPASARLRAAHLQAVVRLTPATMAANLCSASVVVWAYSPAVPPGMWLWLGVMVVLVALGLLGWGAQRHRQRETASPRAMHRATWHAACLAGIWAVVPATWFGAATHGQQMVVSTLVTGMIGAGSFVLASTPLASVVYVALYTASALVALYRADLMTSGVAALISVYSPMVLAGSFAAWRKSTALLRAQARSALQEQTLAVLLHDFEQGADEALWETGLDGRLRHLSPRLAGMLGVDKQQAEALPLASLLEQLCPADAHAFRRAMDAGRPFRDLQLEVSGGQPVRHLAANGKRLFDEAGRTLGWRGVLADVTQKVQAEQRLRQLAHTDSLTGLANRFMLRDVLGEVVRQPHPAALLMIDLDHFKTINDSLGHNAGDEVLKFVAERLRRCVRPGDLVARLGGDEFAVVMVLEPRPASDDETPDATEMARRIIDALSQPMDMATRRLRVGASVGVTAFAGPGQNVDELLVQADTSLYAAKAAGRGRYAIYEKTLGDQSRRRLAVEEGLRLALELNQLSLHWQPKVEIATWRIVGAEALMRWNHPELGTVHPSEFIAVAEQCGLIDLLGAWALRQACAAAAGPLQGLTVSVNVSPLQLRDEQFVGVVRDALREHGLPPARLELEITESVFIDDAHGALEHLHALRSLGVRVALDDFGTGYSSLAYLRRFPFDTLKIDRAFVNEVLVRADARAIVQMICHLASTLGMRAVCEGVETPLQLNAVAQAGCHEMQGYLVSKPRPLDSFQQLQREWRQQVPEGLSALR